MPIKVFTTIDGPCPFGTGHAIDSTGCRKCQYFYRIGTAMFFWCSHPVEQGKPKRGRPKKSEPVKPVVKTKKRGERPKKGKESRIKVIKQSIK